MNIHPSRLILCALILIEIAIFGAIGTNFLSLANGLEVCRLSVEIGLLAVALTPVIVGGMVVCEIPSSQFCSSVP